MRFILVGVLLLLNNIGRMEWWVWGDILALWPLILIAIGIEKIFQNTKLVFISYLSTVALVAVVIWASLGSVGLGHCWFSFGGQTRYEIDTDENISRISTVINMDDDDLYLKAGNRYLFASRYEGFGRSPEVDYNIDDDVARFEITERDGWPIVINHGGTTNDLEISFSEQLPITLNCSGDDSDMKLDFRKLKLENLTVDSEDGRIRILIGDRVGNVKLALEGDDADFRLQFPENSGVRVFNTDKNIERYLKRIGMVESDRYFETEGYDSLTPRIDIELSGDLSRLSIRYY